jgi:hypothetical protein
MTVQSEDLEPEAYTAPLLAEVGEFTEDTLGWFGSWMDMFIFYPAP